MSAIDKVIKKCPYRNTKMKGKDRTNRYAICELHCLPCSGVVESGRCEALIEYARKELGQ